MDVFIIITDTGIGIPEDKFDTIFQDLDKLMKMATFNKSEGSGIGLALCKSMIEMHNGSINVNSKIDQGTSFILTLPIEKADNITSVHNLQNKSKNKNDALQVEYSDFSKLRVKTPKGYAKLK